MGFAALGSGAHVLIEGPPGTGKSTLLRHVASGRSVPFFLVEGNAELTPARLVGHFDPALVLSSGYRPDVFVDGPLVEALRCGGLLYVEELNRVPEETLNVLLTVMSERELNVPRLGRVVADDGSVATTFTNGTTGGAAYAIALGSKLRRPAQMTLVTFSDGEPIGLQPIDITTGGTFEVQPWQSLPPPS